MRRKILGFLFQVAVVAAQVGCIWSIHTVSMRNLALNYIPDWEVLTVGVMWMVVSTLVLGFIASCFFCGVIEHEDGYTA